MNALSIVLLALSIPTILIGLLLPPLLLQDRLQAVSAKFPDELRRVIGMDKQTKISGWDYLILMLTFVPAFTPDAMQKAIAVIFAILLVFYAALRARVYLKARGGFSHADVEAKRLLLFLGLGAGVSCLLFLTLSVWLVTA